MRYALDGENKKVLAFESGELARCPNCNSVVHAKCGEFKINHWAHKASPDCDNWSEPITQWHIDWQEIFPEECREVTLKENGISHRADIMFKNGLVIEIQNSPISIDSISDRESFYGRNKMIWILNGENLLKHSSITYKFVKQEFSLFFSIPHYIPGYEEDDFNNSGIVYNMDKFQQALIKNEFLAQLINHENTTKFKIDNGNHFRFEFSSEINFKLVSEHLYKLFDYTCKKFNININVHEPRMKDVFPVYNWDFDVDYVNIPREMYTSVYLDKKYWRRFIDKITFPVFIDKLNGLEDNLLYWYQENKIIKKSDVVNKYLKYA